MSLSVALPSCSSFRAKRIDFAPYMGGKLDKIVPSIVETLRSELASGENSPATWNTVIAAVRSDFLPWLATAGVALRRKLKLTDINARLMEEFAADLRVRCSYSTASNKFTSIMMLVQAMARLAYLRPSDIRLTAQFPGVAAAQVGTRAYSARERNEILRAVAGEFRGIRDGDHPTLVPGSKDSLAIGLVLLALPTGMNLTPLLELTRAAMHVHPLRKNEWVLVAHKRRGNKPVRAQAKWSDEIAQMRSLDLHLVPVYRQLLAWTEAHSALAVKKNRGLLFIRPPLQGSGRKGSRPVQLTVGDFGAAVSGMNRRYNLVADTGDRLRISTRRIRATVAARIYDLSGGDPFVVARVLGNLPRTTALSYLEPGHGAAAAFSKATKDFAARLREATATDHQATAVAGCSDPLHGRFAPKDGSTYCERWLHCFQCPNQCITGDDDALWRLYSFYWLLQARRQVLMRLPVAGQVRFVLHVIDTAVAKKFGARALRARDRARQTPHPLWAEAKALEGLFVGYGNG